MRALLLVPCALVLVAAAAYRIDAQRLDADRGSIEEISGDAITVRGEKGLHVFELIGICDWCESGEDVMVYFTSLTRADMRPEPNPFRKPVVKMFIQRDGRFEAF